MGPDHRHAPDHLVAQLADFYPQPRPAATPHDDPRHSTVDVWRDNIRALADRIWAEAWNAGAAYGMSTAFDPTRTEPAPDHPAGKTLGERLAANQQRSYRLSADPT